MAHPKRKPDLISAEDYFAGEIASDTKHEFVNGMVYAMAGGTLRHDTIKTNIAATLNFSLPNDCRVASGDVQLGHCQNVSDEWYHYPDVFVVCGVTDDHMRRRDDALVIVEVLSESTERSDRYEKFERSKTLPKLQEYVLVEQSMPRMEIYRKGTGWKQEFVHPDDALELESIKQTLTFEQVYRRVRFDEAEAG